MFQDKRLHAYSLYCFFASPKAKRQAVGSAISENLAEAGPNNRLGQPAV